MPSIISFVQLSPNTWPFTRIVTWVHICSAYAHAPTLLSVVALAGASSSLHIWSTRATLTLEEHDFVKALTGAHCMGMMRDEGASLVKVGQADMHLILRAKHNGVRQAGEQASFCTHACTPEPG
jgi:hypothetical protein